MFDKLFKKNQKEMSISDAILILKGMKLLPIEFNPKIKVFTSNIEGDEYILFGVKLPPSTGKQVNPEKDGV